jgi:Uma2 family endonuclease
MATAPKYWLPPEDEIFYPETDGKPMGETGYHVVNIIYLHEALRRYFLGEQVYVAADMFLYYVRGDPRKVKAPDVMVIKGVDKHFRRTFKTWEEKALPCVVFEITSASTIREDRGPKRELYASLGVAEYFLFDPEREALDPPLHGFRLKGKQYVSVKPARDGSLTCKELGLRLYTEGNFVRLAEAKTGAPLLTAEEIGEQERQRAEQERQRAEQERQRADRLAAEVARLQEELARKRRRK